MSNNPGNVARVSSYGTAMEDRKPNEFYSTPYFCTESLIKEMNIPKHASILEPACGKNAIVDVFKRHNYINIEHFDQMFETGREGIKKDFFLHNGFYDYIITNPPFSEMNKFLEHALAHAAEKVIFLLPFDYCHGKDRYAKFYSKGLLEKVLIFNRRIMFGLDDPSVLETNGMITMAWFVFSGKSKTTELKFIDCDIPDKNQQELFT